jgi:hypothetical protein
VWDENRFRLEIRKLGSSPRAEAWLNYSKKWTNLLEGTPDNRVIIAANPTHRERLDLSAVGRILSHPTAGTQAVFIAIRAPALDLQWQWPLRISAFPDDFDALGLGGLRKTPPSESLTEARPLTRDQARCEVLVIRGGVKEGLRRVLEIQHSVRAGYILVLGPVDISWQDTRSLVEALLSETQAGGLSVVCLPGATSVKVLNDWVRELSHNQPIDLALAKVMPRELSLHVLDTRMLEHTAFKSIAQQLGQRLRELPERVAFILDEKTPLRMRLDWTSERSVESLGSALVVAAKSLPSENEADSGMGLKEIATAERNARLEAAGNETPRVLQGNLNLLGEGRKAKENHSLIVGQRYQLDVFIGPSGEGKMEGEKPFPDEQIDWQQKESCTLQLIFTEFNQWADPLIGTLELPRVGASSNCRFIFSPTRPGSFVARITVYYRGRVLQTALFRGNVLPKGTAQAETENTEQFHFDIEAEIWRSLGTLEDRRRFDACMVLNRTATGENEATVGAKDGAFITSLDEIKDQLSSINSILSEAAHNSKPREKNLLSKANAKLLCALALEGSWLHRKLVVDYIDRSSAAQALHVSEYLQIVTMKPDAIVPLEFVYEYPPPKTGAPVCKNAAEALKNGRCSAGCLPTESPAPYVCPLGFWGLRKVIERHIFDPNLGQTAQIQAGQMRGRDELNLNGPSLLAASKQVPAVSRALLEKTMKAAWRGGVTPVKKWADWPSLVKEKKPVLLMALPHADGVGVNISLEINGDVLESIYIDKSYVLSDPALRPIVLLLGCDVTNVADPGAYVQHIAIFRQAQAAMVLGTVAAIFGLDAAKMAARLVTRLAETAKKSPQRFGEILRHVKREAVADGLMLALCLVAFGDADWYLR